MLVGASNVISMLQEYRLCWISGRFSGGKTSVAYRLAYDFLQRGYRLISTNMSVWSDDFESVTFDSSSGSPKLRCVFILDEGGLYFKSTSQIEEIAAFAAKMDCIYIIPSFFPPVRSAQVLIIQPIFGLRGAGVPLVVYKWRVKIGSFSDSGIFFWWRPSEVYGVYSRQDPGDTPEQVINFLIQKTSEYKAYYAKQRGKNSVPEVEGSGRFVGASDIDRLVDVAEDFRFSVEEFATFSSRRGRRKHF